MSPLLSSAAGLLYLSTLLAPAALSNETGGLPDRSACHLLGPGGGGALDLSGTFAREEWVYWENCDGEFDNGYCWDWLVLRPPYDGAFAERYHGPALVHAIRIYLTGIGETNIDDLDLFVWGDGLGQPGCVLAVKPEIVEGIPTWPDVTAHDLEIEVAVGPDFYVGLWDDPKMFGCPLSWFIAADEDGPGGAPWTYIPPDVGYPTGWQNPDMVWPGCVSLGLGVYTSGAAAVPDSDDEAFYRGTTWGALKALFD